MLLWSYRLVPGNVLDKQLKGFTCLWGQLSPCDSAKSFAKLANEKTTSASLILDFYLEFEDFIWSLKILSGVWQFYLEFEDFIWSLTILSGVWRFYLEFDDFIWSLKILSGVWVWRCLSFFTYSEISKIGYRGHSLGRWLIFWYMTVYRCKCGTPYCTWVQVQGRRNQFLFSKPSWVTWI